MLQAVNQGIAAAGSYVVKLRGSEVHLGALPARVGSGYYLQPVWRSLHSDRFESPAAFLREDLRARWLT